MMPSDRDRNRERTAPDPGDITPESKVGRILERWPGLEDVLVEMSPAFRKLRNPVLRKTVARVATLRQVADVGNVDLGTLINRLRQEAGLGGITVEGESSSSESAGPPAWYSGEAVVKTFDARPVITSGGQPLGTVMEDIGRLEPGQIYELVTPFVPAPLIERVREKGFLAWSSSGPSGTVRTFITPADS